MIAFRSIIPDSVTKSIDILTHLAEMKSVDDCPNYCVALKILCILPVTVASGERSFSTQKLIKTYLRSSMHQERLNNLAMLSIENGIGQSLNYDDEISKSRKVVL
jgi:hAT family C-terminal dimerisation region